MADITAKLVKELRDKTDAGMMDCKRALTETGGDLEAAAIWLRKKGLSKAAKKAGRVAADGLVGVTVKANGAGATGAVVEVNAETDFVARNDTFQAFVSEVAALAVDAGGDVERLKAAAVTSGKPVGEALTELIATVGENMSLRRTQVLAVEEGAVAGYIHSAVADGLGKIGVLVGLKSSGDKAKLEDLGRKLAMHVAAASPVAARTEDIDAATVAREREILADKARQSGKPDNIVEKMVEGGLAKFYKESVFLNQIYVVDGETPVAKVLENAAGDVGAPVELVGFVRFALGEGVEKNGGPDDFAAEVAALTGQP